MLLDINQRSLYQRVPSFAEVSLKGALKHNMNADEEVSFGEQPYIFDIINITFRKVG